MMTATVAIERLPGMPTCRQPARLARRLAPRVGLGRTRHRPRPARLCATSTARLDCASIGGHGRSPSSRRRARRLGADREARRDRRGRHERPLCLMASVSTSKSATSRQRLRASAIVAADRSRLAIGQDVVEAIDRRAFVGDLVERARPGAQSARGWSARSRRARTISRMQISAARPGSRPWYLPSRGRGRAPPSASSTKAERQAGRLVGSQPVALDHRQRGRRDDSLDQAQQASDAIAATTAARPSADASAAIRSGTRRSVPVTLRPCVRRRVVAIVALPTTRVPA